MKTIQQLKFQIRQIANDKLPYHWLESLLLFVLNKNKTFLITHEDYVLSDDEWQTWCEGLDKLTQGTPLAYITGSQGFFGHEFKVNEHTLIPRPDTEILIETVLDLIQVQGLTKGRILDLGTGSGCIAISLAKALSNNTLSNWQIVGVDNSAQALLVANDNKQLLNADNCQFVQSYWFDELADKCDVNAKWQFIVSNPPYIAPHDEHLTHLTHEPISALVADDDGLSDIRHIANQATAHLRDNGYLIIEHGFNQSQAVQAIFAQAGFDKIRTVKDYGANDRITLGIYRTHS